MFDKLLIIAVISLFASLSTTAQGKYTEVDLNVNGVRSGSSMQKVRSLGRPNRIKSVGLNECANQYERTIYFPGLEIGVLGSPNGQRGTVYSLIVTSRRWLIAPGLRVGADRKSVLKAFGKPDTVEDGKIYYVTKGNLGGVTFEFRNNRLVRAQMTETLC